MFDPLETRTMLSASAAVDAATGGSTRGGELLHPSEVERAGHPLHRPTLAAHHWHRHHALGASWMHRKLGLPRRPAPGAAALNEFPLLNRLAEFVPSSSSPFGGTWVPVPSQSVGVGNSSTVADNVYVIAHGWMPGYISWVDAALKKGDLPTSWETWQGPNTAYTPSTPWLYQGSSTDLFWGNFVVNTTGLAEEILSVDPHATVLAYSWIDQSATSTTLGLPKDAYHSEAYTTMNGLRMAEALMSALGPNYAQGLGKVHLIGHSHGSRVATVAAVALQQAAAQDPSYNVVGQLTLLDSPEDNGAAFSSIDPLNPITIDAANFDWFYLSQLNIAQSTPPSSGASSGASPVFVDSYVSYFGSDYGGFTVNDPSQGIANRSLAGVVDVNLGATSVFHSYDVSLMHEYAANWYAGSAGTSGTAGPVGLMWSPLIPGTKRPFGLQGTFTQQWASVDAAHQYLLTPTGNAPAVTPKFLAVTLQQSGKTQGDVTLTGPSKAVTGVTLDDKGSQSAAFRATMVKNSSSVEGFSFNYDFTGGSSDGAQLQILLNGRPYFAMTGSVAESPLLPGSGQFTATFGLGYESSLFNQDVEIRLVRPAGTPAGTPTTVNVSQFHEFTLGSNSATPGLGARSGKPPGRFRGGRPRA